MGLMYRISMFIDTCAATPVGRILRATEDYVLLWDEVNLPQGGSTIFAITETEGASLWRFRLEEGHPSRLVVQQDDREPHVFDLPDDQFERFVRAIRTGQRQVRPDMTVGLAAWIGHNGRRSTHYAFRQDLIRMLGR